MLKFSHKLVTYDVVDSITAKFNIHIYIGVCSCSVCNELLHAR